MKKEKIKVRKITTNDWFDFEMLELTPGKFKIHNPYIKNPKNAYGVSKLRQPVPPVFESGDYEITCPDFIITNGKYYFFDKWEDGVTTKTRTITLDRDTTLIADYIKIPKGFAFITCLDWDILYVVDFRNPSIDPNTGLEIYNFLHVIQSREYLRFPRLLDIYDKYVFVGGEESLTVIDISEFYNPKFVNKISALGPGTDLNAVGGVVAKENRLYAVGYLNNAFAIYDISDIYNIELIGYYNDPSGRTLNYPFGDIIVDTKRKLVFIPNDYASMLTVIDISDETNPSVLSTLVDSTYLYGILHMEYDGKYIYASCWASNRLTIIDVSDPTNPKIVSSIRDDTLLYDAGGIRIKENYAYVSCFLGARLTIVDISDVLNPRILNSIQIPLYYRPHYLYIRDNFLYQTDYNSTLYVFDISDRINPRLIGYVKDTVYTPGMFHVVVI